MLPFPASTAPHVERLTHGAENGFEDRDPHRCAAGGADCNLHGGNPVQPGGQFTDYSSRERGNARRTGDDTGTGLDCLGIQSPDFSDELAGVGEIYIVDAICDAGFRKGIVAALKRSCGVNDDLRRQVPQRRVRLASVEERRLASG
jgi:hypothetical protein